MMKEITDEEHKQKRQNQHLRLRRNLGGDFGDNND
jgi:hypothetical protein